MMNYMGVDKSLDVTKERREVCYSKRGMLMPMFACLLKLMYIIRQDAG